MPDHRPQCILFAGAPGSSKSPTATYLSYHLKLPIFSNDVVRVEVQEDLLQNDIAEEYEKRRNYRLGQLLSNGDSFIYDASVDRHWSEIKQHLSSNGYSHFIISMDLSRELLEKLYQTKGYHSHLQEIDKVIADHDNFLESFADNVDLHITDDTFAERLELALQAAKSWLGSKHV